MRYTLRQLEVFLATARHENITRAAESLAMSQSAASGALKDLESQFDLQLFDRAGKRLQLNALGRAVRPRALAVLEQAGELELAFAAHDQPGPLELGATLTIGNYLAVGMMARYRELHPTARVRLDVANTSVIARRVRDFELDLGLIEGELQHPDLEVLPWRDDELVVFAAPDHRLARRRRLDDDDLRGCHWIVREAGSGTRQTFDRAMAGILPELHITLELQHTEAIKRAVAAGLGVGCLSRLSLADAFGHGTLVPLPVTHRNLARRFYIILHRQKYRSAAIEAWLELCREDDEPRNGAGDT